MVCAVCGAYAGRWLQWPNQDDGFGLCAECPAWLTKRGMSAAEMLRVYGRAGVHYEQKAAAPVDNRS